MWTLFGGYLTSFARWNTLSSAKQSETYWCKKRVSDKICLTMAAENEHKNNENKKKFFKQPIIRCRKGFKKIRLEGVKDKVVNFQNHQSQLWSMLCCSVKLICKMNLWRSKILKNLDLRENEALNPKFVWKVLKQLLRPCWRRNFSGHKLLVFPKN